MDAPAVVVQASSGFPTLALPTEPPNAIPVFIFILDVQVMEIEYMEKRVIVQDVDR